jgi:hypothetical protein
MREAGIDSKPAKLDDTQWRPSFRGAPLRLTVDLISLIVRRRGSRHPSPEVFSAWKDVFVPETQGQGPADRSPEGRADRRGERNQRQAARQCAILETASLSELGDHLLLRLSGWISPPVRERPVGDATRPAQPAGRTLQAPRREKHGRPPLGRWGPPEPLLWRTAGIRSRAAAPHDPCVCGAPPLLSARGTYP